MIEVVSVDDMLQLEHIHGNDASAKKRAVSILVNIIARMPHPRAYICEPNLDKDDPRELLWTVVYDMLTGALRWDDAVYVVEPDTLRFLASRTASLLNFTTQANPFWQTLTAFHLIDVLYIPDKEGASDCYKEMRARAKQLNIRVEQYRPRVEEVRVPRVAPPTT